MNVVSAILLTGCILLFYAIVIIVASTMGLAVASAHRSLRSIGHMVSILAVSSLSLTVISIPLLIKGFIQVSREKDIYRGYKKTVTGIILACVIIFFFMLLLAYSFYAGITSEQWHEKKREAIINISPHCPAEGDVCKNLSVSMEENAIYFTLINKYDEDITLGRIKQSGDCINGRLEYYQRENMKTPIIVNSTNPSINLHAKEEIDIKVKCQSIVRSRIDRPSNLRFTFSFSKAGQSDLNYHIYYGGFIK